MYRWVRAYQRYQYGARTTFYPPPSARTCQLRRAIILQPSTFSHLYQTGGHATPFSVIFPPNYHSSQPTFNFFFPFFVGYLSGWEKSLDIVFHRPRGDGDNIYIDLETGDSYLFIFSLSFFLFPSGDAKQIDRRGNLRTVPKISPRNSSRWIDISHLEGCSRWKYRRTDGRRTLLRFGEVSQDSDVKM